MRRTWATISIFALALGVAIVVAASQRSTSSGGFAELHRAQLAQGGNVEIVMGLIERDGESRSGKHHHPGGEFGFVISGTIVVTTEDSPAETLEAGDSFYQPPGEWHVVSTGAAGARTVVFRVIETGQPMVVPVE
jgi:quercetin dioxygenase-like cupin family protein